MRVRLNSNDTWQQRPGLLRICVCVYVCVCVNARVCILPFLPLYPQQKGFHFLVTKTLESLRATFNGATSY